MSNERKNAFTVALMIGVTLISKLLGMLRGVFLAANYGTGIESEAFAAASKIPLTFFDLLLGAAILGCFIPAYNSFSKGREKEQDRFASSFINGVVIITVVISALGMIFSRELLSVLTPRLSAEAADIAATLLKIMFPMIILTGVTYVLVGVLQSKNSFIIPALISSVSNIAIIVYFVFFDSTFKIKGLAFAYLFAWLMQFLILIFPLVKNKFRYSLAFEYTSSEMKNAVKSVLPVMAGSWLSPATVLIGAFFAPFTVVEGAVAVFDYANGLFIIISGILTYGICNFIFPTLSKLANEKDSAAYSSEVKNGISSMLFIIIPVAAAVLVLSGEIVSIVYRRGDFDAVSARNTAYALEGFAVGIIGYSLVELLNRVFYSVNKPYIPVISALMGIAVNILSALFFVFSEREGVSSVFKISLGNSLGLLTGALFLLYMCKRNIKNVFDKKFFINTLKLFSCGICSYVAMSAVSLFVCKDSYTASFFVNVLNCVIVFSTGIIIYITGCFVLDTEQKYSVINILRISK